MPKWVWLVLVAILASCVIGWEMFGPPAKKRAADRALKAALAACRQGGRLEVDRRVVEAELAFHDLDIYDQTMYEAKLDAGLIVGGMQMRKTPGVYEYPKGSGVYWIHWYDHGRTEVRGQK